MSAVLTGLIWSLALMGLIKNLGVTACHSVPVQDGYVVVQPTYVWANMSQYHMPVPIDGGDVETLVAALVQRSNGQRTGSLYHP
jgi:hypothetical protein